VDLGRSGQFNSLRELRFSPGELAPIHPNVIAICRKSPYSAWTRLKKCGKDVYNGMVPWLSRLGKAQSANASIQTGPTGGKWERRKQELLQITAFSAIL
jgi:hypothetical protein